MRNDFLRVPGQRSDGRKLSGTRVLERAATDAAKKGSSWTPGVWICRECQ
jgi:hypothetical protein